MLIENSQPANETKPSKPGRSWKFRISPSGFPALSPWMMSPSSFFREKSTQL